MYLIPIAWLYVALMMAAAEATNPQGTVVGAVFTFLLYGVGPVAIVMYIMDSPRRRRRRRALEKEADAAAAKAAEAPAPDAEADGTTRTDA